MNKRNLDLMPRVEGTRDKFHTKVVRFELDQIMQHFTETMEIIKKQFAVADELVVAGRTPEGENIWRAQIVFLASALDFYMHELTKYGLCEIYDEKWEKTEKYKNLQISMEMIEVAVKSGEETDWLLEYFNEYYQTITMVSYDSVKEQLKLLGVELSTVADRAFYQKGETEKTRNRLKRRLNELFARRNIIAHQTDRAHTDAQFKMITKEIVHNFIEDIGKVVKAIDAEVRSK